ncbi:MAG TPA: nucleoid-associated protein [Ktedonobacterales bacterium]
MPERHPPAPDTPSVAATAQWADAGDLPAEVLRRPRRTRSAGVAPVAAVSPAASPAAGGICIERLILHQLDSARGRLELVDDVVTLDERVATFFAGHLASAAERADWQADFEDAAADVPLLCAQLLADEPARFVAASRQLALRLYDQMRARPNLIAPGDFVVAVFRGADGRSQLALLKLDLDNQRLVREFTRVGQRTNVRVAAAENLLPEARRLQKCALLRPASSGGFELTLLDTQAGPRSDGVAAFFYRGFLTAALVPSARRRTRLFLSTSETWLAQNGTQFTPAQLFGFYRARRAALAGDTLDLAAFAARALPEIGPLAKGDAQSLQGDLVARLRAALFAPGEPEAASAAPVFAVDRATADPVVRTVTLELDGGARLRMGARLFDALVQVAPQRTGDGKLRLAIESLTLREVAGG